MSETTVEPSRRVKILWVSRGLIVDTVVMARWMEPYTRIARPVIKDLPDDVIPRDLWWDAARGQFGILLESEAFAEVPLNEYPPDFLGGVGQEWHEVQVQPLQDPIAKRYGDPDSNCLDSVRDAGMLMYDAYSKICDGATVPLGTLDEVSDLHSRLRKLEARLNQVYEGAANEQD